MQYAHPLPNAVKIRKREREWAEKERKPMHSVDQGKKPNIFTIITNYFNSI